MFYRQSKLFALLLLTVIIHSVHAETIDIKAKYLLLDDKKGVSQYKGNVLLTKGSLIIKADTIIIYHVNNELTKALITGSPADVQHQPENEEKVHSQANKMEYFVSEERLLLTGQAFVDQGEQHFSGESIEYNTRERIITAAGNSNKNTEIKEHKNATTNKRVHVIIGPASEKTDKEE